MAELTIGEVARRAGLRPSALRYYESVGLLDAPRRRQTRRYYDPGVLQQLAVIAVAQQAGFTVAEIGVLLHGFGPAVTPSARWQALAAAKLPEVEALIARAQAMKRVLEEGLNCGCVRFEECVIVAGQGCVAGPTGSPPAAGAGGDRATP
ncbi:MAG TPA: MerR family transcriptional regulator [Chloroflexia bacterium]|nr:MerR family transcriptional regulator [Chloroflexia bacterium]